MISSSQSGEAAESLAHTLREQAETLNAPGRVHTRDGGPVPESETAKTLRALGYPVPPG